MQLEFKTATGKKGFAAMFVILLVLAIMFGIGLSAINLILGQQEISRNMIKSSQAYYAAESGIEDALLKLTKIKTWASLSGLQVGDAWVTTTISTAIGSARTIISEGNSSGRVKKIQVLYEISTNKVSFYYGAQVGNGGMVMGNNSRIIGNVFSNGSVIGGGTIDNSIVVAGNGNKIQGINVGGDASVYTCDNADITGTLYYVSGGSYSSCSYGAAIDKGSNEIDPIPLPISQDEVDDWKISAAKGGIINEDVSYSGVLDAGPVQIGTPVLPKNLTITTGSIVTLKGTIYVTGDIIFQNISQVKLDSSIYDVLSGMIIADGKITINNGTILSGSGQPSSYVLILSTNSSLDPSNPAIYVGNNAQGAIIYTTSGIIFLKNNMKAKEITGYKVQIENNAEVEYESGLENANFSGGTGGSWEVSDWKEIE